MNKSTLFPLLITLFVIWSSPNLAKAQSIYKCKLDNGRYKYTSVPCSDAEAVIIPKDEPTESSASEGLPNSDTGASNYDAYEEFLVALRAYLNASSESTPEAFARRGKRHTFLESAARILAVQTKTPAQRENLLKELRRMSKMYERTALTGEPRNYIRRAQLRNSIQEVERALGVR